MRSLAIFGYGYVAKFLIKELLPDNKVIVVTRHPENVTDKNVSVLHFDDYLPEADGIISTIPPIGGADPVLEKYLPTCWAAYCSSTGVYGDHQGDWVTEESLCNPSNERGRQRLEIEKKWMALPNACVLRIAGIYGPGRSVFDQLDAASAKRIDKPGHVFSRIHVEDIAGFSHFAFSNGLTGIYNLADNLPAPSRAVVEFACDLLGKNYPPLVSFDQANLLPMAFEFYQDCKKVSAEKIAAHGYRVKFKNYADGLVDIIKNQHQEKNPQ
jgi:nucleoside-diphosphate-sugar epimerase